MDEGNRYRQSIAGFPRLNNPSRVSIAPIPVDAPRLSIGGPLQKQLASSSSFDSTRDRENNKTNFVENEKYIVLCLAKHNYPYEIQGKTLRNMTDQDFCSITRFLFKLLDPGLQCGPNEKESFPKMMNLLGYREQFKKSIMSSFTPYTMPTFLAAIAWLCKLVDFKHQSMVHISQRSQSSEEVFNSDFMTAYKHFMSNDDANSDRVINGVMDILAHDIQRIESVSNRLEARFQSVEQEMRLLTEVGREIPRLRSSEETLMNDLVKFKRLVDQRNEALSSEQLHVQTENERCSHMQTQIQDLLSKNAHTRELINNQSVSAEDIDRLNSRRTFLKESCEGMSRQKQSELDHIDKLSYTIDNQVRLVDERIAEYHSLLLSANLFTDRASHTSDDNGKVSDSPQDFMIHLVADSGMSSIPAVLLSPRSQLNRSRAILSSSSNAGGGGATAAGTMTPSSRSRGGGSSDLAQYYNDQITESRVLKRLSFMLLAYQKSLRNALDKVSRECQNIDKKLKTKENEREKEDIALNEMSLSLSRLRDRKSSIQSGMGASDEGTDASLEQVMDACKSIKSECDVLERDISRAKAQMKRLMEEKPELEKQLLSEEKSKMSSIFNMLDTIAKYKQNVTGEVQKIQAVAMSTKRE